MLHTPVTPREREVPERGKFVENLNALVNKCTRFLSFPPSFPFFSRSADEHAYCISFSLSLLPVPPRWTPDQAISTTGVLNATTLIYARRAGITGCWHQTCPLLAFSVVSVHRSFYGTVKPAPLVLLVTTSDVVDWVVCAPAAFLRSMKHISCSFSGVEPKSSVTRHHHRSPLYYG